MAAKQRFAELFALGKTSYEERDRIKAAEHFTEAAKSCPCLTGDPSTLCECKDLMQAMEKEELLECLRRSCVCKVRSKRHCDSEEHMLALNYLAAIAREKGVIKNALRYAQKMVFTQPRDPRGYLRMGQMLRLQKNPNLALKAYAQGLAIVEAKCPDHKYIAKLREQVQEVSKLCRTADPITLPSEVKVMIFEHLSLAERCRCLRVAKLWRQFLFSGAASILWSEQRYVLWRGGSGLRPCRPTEKSLMTNLGKLGRSQITLLEIGDCVSFDMSAKRTSLLLRHCTKLRHLRLGAKTVTTVPLRVPEDIKVAGLSRLKTLSLGCPTDIEFIQALLTASADELEELSITSFPRGYHDLQWPLLPKLRKIMLQGMYRGHIIDLDWITRQTPNITSVRLDVISVVEHPTRPTPSSPRWEKLENLVLLPGVEIVHHTMLPRFSEHLRELDVSREHYEMMSFGGRNFYRHSGAFSANPRYDFDGAWLAADKYAEAFFPEDVNAISPRLSGLRRLALRMVYNLGVESIGDLILASMESNTIQTLKLDPLPDGFISLVQSQHGVKLPVCDSLLALSFSGSNPAAQSSVRDPDSFLMAILSIFPNLKALEIGKDPFPPAALAKAVRQGVRYIFHEQGFAYDEVKQRAAKEGLAKIVVGAMPDQVLDFVDYEPGERVS